MVFRQEHLIPLNMFTLGRVSVGDTFNFNVTLSNGHVVTRCYRIVTIDRVNGVAACVVESEVELSI